jgi:hypothetical protein
MDQPPLRRRSEVSVQAPLHDDRNPGSGPPPVQTVSLDEAVRNAICETIEVTWGGEHFQPMAYHGFDVGPIRATVRLQPGETVIEATVRMHRAMAAAQKLIFAEKLAEYSQKVGEAQAAVARYR